MQYVRCELGFFIFEFLYDQAARETTLDYASNILLPIELSIKLNVFNVHMNRVKSSDFMPFVNS